MIGFISDIHGNYPALSAVIKALEEKGCEEIISLGDVCGYYSMVNECIDLLRKKEILSLRGNHDSYLLGEGKCSRSNSANDCIAFQKKIITSENLNWLGKTKISLCTEKFCAVHGGWHDPIDEYIKAFDFEDPILSKYNVSYFFSGHTHIQSIERKKAVFYCNPGSVGQPRDYDHRASFAILEGEEITLCRVPYDIDQIAEHMQSVGFNEYYFSNLYRGTKIGENR